jgi:hypothetical protein
MRVVVIGMPDPCSRIERADERGSYLLCTPKVTHTEAGISGGLKTPTPLPASGTAHGALDIR